MCSICLYVFYAQYNFRIFFPLLTCDFQCGMIGIERAQQAATDPRGVFPLQGVSRFAVLAIRNDANEWSQCLYLVVGDSKKLLW